VPISDRRRRQAPQLKRDYCLDNGIGMFIDDRLDTCEELKRAGIYALHMLGSPR
jgi:hypothetical protein